jgi:hypothetical protein
MSGLRVADLLLQTAKGWDTQLSPNSPWTLLAGWSCAPAAAPEACRGCCCWQARLLLLQRRALLQMLRQARMAHPQTPPSQMQQQVQQVLLALLPTLQAAVAPGLPGQMFRQRRPTRLPLPALKQGGGSPLGLPPLPLPLLQLPGCRLLPVPLRRSRQTGPRPPLLLQLQALRQVALTWLTWGRRHPSS